MTTEHQQTRTKAPTGKRLAKALAAEPETTVQDQHRVAQRPDGSQYLVFVGELPDDIGPAKDDAYVTELENENDRLLPASAVL